MKWNTISKICNFTSLWFLFLFFQNSQSEDDVWIPFEYDATGFNPGLFLENYFKLLSNDSEFCFQRPKRKSCFKIHNPGIKYYFEGDKLGRTSVLDMLPKLSTALGRLLEGWRQPVRFMNFLAETRFCCFGSPTTFIVANLRKLPNWMG